MRLPAARNVEPPEPEREETFERALIGARGVMRGVLALRVRTYVPLIVSGGGGGVLLRADRGVPKDERLPPALDVRLRALRGVRGVMRGDFSLRHAVGLESAVASSMIRAMELREEATSRAALGPCC